MVNGCDRDNSKAIMKNYREIREYYQTEGSIAIYNPVNIYKMVLSKSFFTIENFSTIFIKKFKWQKKKQSLPLTFKFLQIHPSLL